MWFTLTPAERAHLHEQLRGVADDPRALDMRQFIQHGCVTTYEHCLRVTTLRGAFLHDFYLYDWHRCHTITRWHGFKHPLIARYNADAVFHLNEVEKNIIQSHMWPLTLPWVPRCREAVLVCIADKLAALWETVARRAPA